MPVHFAVSQTSPVNTPGKTLTRSADRSIRRECLDHVIVFHEARFAPDPQGLFQILRKVPHASVRSKKMRPSADLSSLPRSVL